VKRYAVHAPAECYPAFVGKGIDRMLIRTGPVDLGSAPGPGVWRRFRSESGGFLSPRARRLAMLALAVMLCGALAKSAPRPQLIDQSPTDLEAYKNIVSYVDRTPAELAAMIPDLKGLEPAANQAEGEKALGEILGRVGENVRQYCKEFPDTTSREDITMERLRPDGEVDSARQEAFRYLAVSHTEHGSFALREYRTDLAGKPSDPTGLEQGLVVTKGFASEMLYFHPAARSDAFFRYLGTQIVDGKETDVVAFAQRPGWASLTVRVMVGGRSAAVLVQGVAWIDSTSYQIIRMRTDLLAPRPDLGLLGETVVTTFGEVRFPEKPKTVLWLPQDVTVTAQWKGKATVTRVVTSTDPRFNEGRDSIKWESRTYRNIHHYSDYRLFASESKLKF
jgi:hypothetical protein